MRLPPDECGAARELETQRLFGLFETEWERTLREFPIFSSELGDRRHNRQWPDMSLDGIENRHREDLRVLMQLESIDPTKLSLENQLNFTLFRKKYETSVEEHSLRWHLLPLTAREGIQDASVVADAIEFEAVQDYEDWLARIHAFPNYMEQTLALMQKGVGEGMVHAKVVMSRVPAQIRAQIVEAPEESLFFKPFRRFPARIPKPTQDRLISEARRGIEASVMPAYEQMLNFFLREYLPACSDRVGVWQLPRGSELYAFFARKYTTTEYTPREIHDIGLEEVQRIRAQMEEIVQEVNFRGSWGDFLQHLRTSPQFYYSSAAELAAAYNRFCERIDAQLPALFYRLPRVWYDIQPVPSNIAPDTTTAYYRPPSADGKRAGTFFVNLHRPDVRPRYEIPALSLHEAVPGHHLQIARSMEMDDLPAFRRYTPDGGFSAYVEGWALYAEGLGEELGCYENPFERFGRLSYDIWRAARLVVDTGLHSFRWSREQAVNYFIENTAKTPHDVENEIDRYIAWPGQALAYKIGGIEMTRMRRHAAARLGAEFDLRTFHEVVLGRGPLPLDILALNVERWIAECLKKPL